ncbi:TPA: type VI secretion system baseplate subunit TssE [Klebsiella oxytoca]|uniref:Type VI secretion system baseplate subunit TssE n=1 Tax=Klebsiella oxytoca TaxID=571 RepID=A0AAN5LAN7_KLEOX|nr:type VI secretion system baseplate subunit TssE [Klebsiella oxytoca]
MSSLSSWDRGSAASLFDRIRGQERDMTQEAALDTLIDSIKRQLDRVLNTRPGNCRSAPDLGVIDLNDATQSCADVLSRIREAIRQCICEYEPRIVQVEVSSADNISTPLEMSFHVLAHVRLDENVQVASFNIYMDSHRHYRMI